MVMIARESRYVFVFDVDGTLIDSVDSHLKAVNYIMKLYNLPSLTLAVYREKRRGGYSRFYEELGIEASSEELHGHYWPVFISILEVMKPGLFPNVREVLFFLKQYMGQMILMTTQEQEAVDLYHSYTSLYDFFHQIYVLPPGSRKYQQLKEIKENIELSSPDFENIFIFISDTPDDLIEAQSAGWMVYGVPTGFSSAGNLQAVIQPGKGALIQDLLELKEMFASRPHNII